MKTIKGDYTVTKRRIILIRTFCYNSHKVEIINFKFMTISLHFIQRSTFNCLIIIHGVMLLVMI